ncbi:1,6-anhydro-N-acetylmuramyl-L-alanine amidase AmpD [Hahella sp. KA22]|uniref:1,6-anhydro-N-acetylmuramyl-L-alanine amidase AmpD n=2 Tax=Hahella sp. KA22 TaxID=1628392 RepID=UPI000FDD03BE|nr:1,6-anhydro-N-acetylmuramyl-L-alanine amidase AmpD [Hahella sp. KA22]AZZ93578.1 1,6-anhydro-N-acetylmuramyl-L-alanine amidase AmpD [Hahella sp. KA22]QAY56953.1 1,6-anhydro-N-acetylmuramyl-L-alanine amidase AmpD [Hahella sp. KA22]
MENSEFTIDAQGWLSLVKRMPSPNFNQRPTGAEISLLVVHNISLPPAQFRGEYVCDFFLNRLDCEAHPYFREIGHLQVSSHLFIRRDGEVIQFVSLHDRAWHAGRSSWLGRDNCNDYSIGVELEGADDIPYEAIQYQRLACIARTICRAFPLITADRVVGHSDIAPGRKTDPGPAFDWPKLRKLMSNEEG